MVLRQVTGRSRLYVKQPGVRFLQNSPADPGATALNFVTD